MGALARLDALSGLANIASVAPKLVMTNLNDESIAWPSPPNGSANYYYTDITGSDSFGYGPASLSSVLNSTGYIRREMILAPADVVANTWADIATVFDVQTVANDFPGGIGNKVVMTQLNRTSAEWTIGKPQMWNATYVRNTFTNPIPPLCYRWQMKLPSNMIDVLSGNAGGIGWCENFALKANNNDSISDSRLSLQTVKVLGESDLRFRISFDLFINYLDGSATPGGPANLWYMQSALGAAIPGDVYDIYLYFKPPASNTDLVTGLCQILIVNLSKNTISFADEKYGEPMRGYNNYEIGRILTQSLYTGGFPTTGNFQMEYSGMQFWSCMPVI